MKLLVFPFLSLQCSELCSEVNLLEGLLTLSRAGSGTGGVRRDGEGPLDVGAAHCSVGEKCYCNLAAPSLRKFRETKLC